MRPVFHAFACEDVIHCPLRLTSPSPHPKLTLDWRTWLPMKYQSKLRLRSAAIAVGISFFFGMTYPIVFGQITSFYFLMGGLLGIMMPVSALSFEWLYVQKSRGAWIRRLPFGLFAVVKFFAYLMIIFANIAIAIFLIFPESRARGAFREFWMAAIDLQTIVISLTVFLMFSVGMSLGELLGRGVLTNFLTGRYHRPRREKRVFVFIDMIGSTAIAEKLGDLEYHRLLNRFFSDLAGAIVENRGTVTNYIGDELIATWLLKRGFAGRRSIQAVLDAHDLLCEMSTYYEREFGVQPRFRAGLHMGDVVTGEMGDQKREIVYVGDVMNTTSRIQAACRDLNQSFLVSEDVLKDVQLPEGIPALDMGKNVLRGKEDPVHLYAIDLNAYADSIPLAVVGPLSS